MLGVYNALSIFLIISNRALIYL